MFHAILVKYANAITSQNEMSASSQFLVYHYMYILSSNMVLNFNHVHHVHETNHAICFVSFAFMYGTLFVIISLKLKKNYQ